MSRAEATVPVHAGDRTFELPLLAFQGSPSTLCKGCGHNSITSALIDACKSLGINPYSTVKLSGIGCSSKTPAYFLNYSHGFNALHGRMPSVATGAALANARLTVVGISGDGDTANIGLGQFKHACRRNLPMVYLVEDNGCYGLTKGQFSATADLGAPLRRASGERNTTAPLDLCLEAIAAGASFVARSFAGDRKQLGTLLRAALAHRGMAFLDIISPCVTFNDFPESHKGWDWAKAHEEPLQELGFVPHFEPIEVEQVEGEATRVRMHDGSWITLRALSHAEHDVTDRASALRLLLESREADEFVTGLLYLDSDRPDFVTEQDLVDRPLALLDDESLRPSREAFEAILAEL
ncbi:2-oxoacid:ferredoxin oxidoreductase subunit beta [Tautonia sociabilis]|uniref:2-oxoacid:ferredoxin oxidoreductase subunit beta n=1 Tax=Tautonia sociabilis TaxID=2080755 RepID=A0A432MNY4_9BACT|nr:2-oxoacid:ferredoxin oxidoreductase subunit beta [Tautonia sociabilis]RUL89163.1 2-oxoacid:ferredoxin oxidoreductase subunit beta [Tautonia sociabilis]